MDTFFLSHGAPTMAIDDIPMRSFLKSWQEKVFQPKPKAILILSGHWDTSEPTINVVDRNKTIYDFYGFPRAMYELKYPAPGSPELAHRVKELLVGAGFRLNIDKKRGLDHGSWVPLLLMYPECDIPVCQLSIQSHKDAMYHYKMGRALAPLRDEGVLIIGSGNTTHNLTDIRPEGSPIASWALTFDKWLTDTLENGRYDDVIHFDEKAPYGKVAHPLADHFFPLHVALGAAGEGAKAELIHNSWFMGTFSYSSYRFTPAQ